MRRKPTDLYLKAARAFWRLHGYPPDPAVLSDQKFMAGWQQGYRAAMRKRLADSAGESHE
jgi:hypothetical protein